METDTAPDTDTKNDSHTYTEADTDTGPEHEHCNSLNYDKCNGVTLLPLRYVLKISNK